MNKEKNEQNKNSYSDVIRRMNQIAESYAPFLPQNTMIDAFYSAGMGMANMTPVQNARVKAISSLPADYTKEEIGEFLRNPYANEKGLRQTSQILRWSAYPYFKITKTYQDIPTYRYYVKPLYLDEQRAKSKEFWRELNLLDKLNKDLRPARRILEECEEKGIHGKETTPFLLARVAELTGGNSLASNIRLVYNNAKIAAQTAAVYAKL